MNQTKGFNIFKLSNRVTKDPGNHICMPVHTCLNIEVDFKINSQVGVQGDITLVSGKEPDCGVVNIKNLLGLFLVNINSIEVTDTYVVNEYAHKYANVLSSTI